MSRVRTTRVALVRTPKISTSWQTIIVETGSMRGLQIFECRGELSTWCATQLIRDLRRALRKIRDEEIAKLNLAVTEAEGQL